MLEAMEFPLAILNRTPQVLQDMLAGFQDGWVRTSADPESWSPFDVVAHLYHSDQVNWIPRVRTILEHGASKSFAPFNPSGHFEIAKGMRLDALLAAFATLREDNLNYLGSLNLTSRDLERPGQHPELGPVTLGELLQTWSVHDLNHQRQVVEGIARQRREAVGPWRRMLPILD